MGRRGKPRFWADGVLVVDKPAGPTSHDVVDRLRRRYRPARLGHAGTLDPFATGVLVLAFNQATRLSELLGAGDKVYRGVLALGTATETGDPTGKVTRQEPVPALSEEEVRRALASLEGERLQTPPPFSAVKHQGRPLYAYAREGKKIEKPPRRIVVRRAILHRLEPAAIELEMQVSRGTYLRSLAEDLAALLGTVGHLASLARLASLPFRLEEAVSLEEALDWGPQELARRLIPPVEALAACGLPAVEVDDELAWRLRQGGFLDTASLLGPQQPRPRPGQPFQVLDPEGGLVAVLRWLEAGKRLPGRDYETIRVFPQPPRREAEDRTSASAPGAE
jgi:tRNA pseudouridine55 synthase